MQIKLILIFMYTLKFNFSKFLNILILNAIDILVIIIAILLKIYINFRTL